ncbi:unnamed protein product, partial [Pylaiella littoralis]
MMGLCRKKRVGVGVESGMPWEDDNALADDQANPRFLKRVRESIDVVLSSGSVEDGVALGACSEMIEYARSFKHVLGSQDTDVILP